MAPRRADGTVRVAATSTAWPSDGDLSWISLTVTVRPANRDSAAAASRYFACDASHMGLSGTPRRRITIAVAGTTPAASIHRHASGCGSSSSTTNPTRAPRS